MPRFCSYTPLLFLILFGLIGCRTYGDYDSKAKTYQAMQRAVQQFSEDLHRAEEDLRLLEQAASDADTLQSLADRFRDLVEEHQLLLEKHREQVETLSPDAGYRTLSRTYRGMAKEHRLLRQHYTQVTRAVRTTLSGEETSSVSTPSVARSGVQDRSSYVIEPLGFPRDRQGEPMSMEEILQSP